MDYHKSTKRRVPKAGAKVLIYRNYWRRGGLDQRQQLADLTEPSSKPEVGLLNDHTEQH